MNQQYYYVSNGKRLGPVGLEQLRQMWAAGELSAHTPVWSQGMPEWSTAMVVLGYPGASEDHGPVTSQADRSRVPDAAVAASSARIDPRRVYSLAVWYNRGVWLALVYIALSVLTPVAALLSVVLEEVVFSGAAGVVPASSETMESRSALGMGLVLLLWVLWTPYILYCAYLNKTVGVWILGVLCCVLLWMPLRWMPTTCMDLLPPLLFLTGFGTRLQRLGFRLRFVFIGKSDLQQILSPPAGSAFRPARGAAPM